MVGSTLVQSWKYGFESLWPDHFYAHVVPSRFERVDVVIGTETVGSSPTVCTNFVSFHRIEHYVYL